MRVLIQNKKTGLFCCDPAGWTSDPEEARAFEHTLEAFRFCKEHQLGDVKIILKFGNEAHDTAVWSTDL